ncbi:hypothetical protein V8G54_024630, partial [Vigna mungo]
PTKNPSKSQKTLIGITSHSSPYPLLTSPLCPGTILIGKTNIFDMKATQGTSSPQSPLSTAFLTISASSTTRSSTTSPTTSLFEINLNIRNACAATVSGRHLTTI